MNKKAQPIHNPVPAFSRRTFVQGLAAGGTLATFGFMPVNVLGETTQQSIKAADLYGPEFELVIDTAPVNFTGQTRTAMTINGSIPGPTLHWREGEIVTLRVTNRLPVSTSVHWHGILLPFQMDGVPGLSYPGIAPGTTFVYRFRVNQSGTYWYHSHTNFQEQNALYGAIVIHPAAGERVNSERDYVVMLNDWSDSDPDFIFNRLKTGNGYYNYVQPTLEDFVQRAQREGFGEAVDWRLRWDRMRMSPRDLLDVTGATYTYLVNGTTPTGDWTGLFQRGERVRLRFINGSSMSYFDVRIPDLKMVVVAVDGQDIHPVSIDEFRIGAAEIVDVVVEPSSEQAYSIFAQAMDRSGYARGTLTPHAEMRASVPAMDPVPTLSMSDMGMKMDMSGMSMSGMAMPMAQSPTGETPHKTGAGGMQDDGNMSGMNMVGQNPLQLPGIHDRDVSNGKLDVTWHPPAEHGVDSGMRAQQVSMRLDDPGAGLRDNGRKVLTFADMHTIGGSITDKTPERGIEIHLTGNMERYIWGFDGVSYADAEPVQLKYGESVRIMLVNDTMMTHPIHLHGLWSELESEQGEFQVRKHTLSVSPGHALTYRVYADAVGRWAYHCHLLYHMNAGMFREVRVS